MLIALKAPVVMGKEGRKAGGIAIGKGKKIQKNPSPLDFSFVACGYINREENGLEKVELDGSKTK